MCLTVSTYYSITQTQYVREQEYCFGTVSMRYNIVSASVLDIDPDGSGFFANPDPDLSLKSPDLDLFQ